MKSKKNTIKPVKIKAKKTDSSTKISKKKGMQYTDGKAAQVDGKEKIRDLEELLNPASRHNPFKASSEEELEGNMGDMTIPDLQSLAVELGVFPSGNRTTLKNKLKKEFRSRHFLGKGRVMQTSRPLANYESMTKEQKELFNSP